MTPERPKPLTWVSSSKRDYLRFPEQVQDDMGYALYVVQMGERPKSAKPLEGFKGSGVLELVENYAGEQGQYESNPGDNVCQASCFHPMVERYPADQD